VTRAWLWTQVAAAWLPVWALFTVLMMDVHGLAFGVASIGSLQLIVAAALLAYPVYRFARRHPWPHPFRAGFALRHVAGAALYAAGWIAVVSVIRSAMVGQLVVAVGPGLTPFLVMGVWLYLIVAGVIYANEAARRAGELEAQPRRRSSRRCALSSTRISSSTRCTRSCSSFPWTRAARRAPPRSSARRCEPPWTRSATS